MRPLAVALVLVFVVGLGGAPIAVAAEPVFGKPTATAAFGVAITLEQRVTLPAGIHRIEAYVREGAEARTFLAEISDPGEGGHTLRYRQATPAGSIFPNTVVELGFRLTFDDGRVVDGSAATVRYEDDRFAWDTLEGELVRVHWYRGGDAFGRRALATAEKGVANASELLGVTETEPIDFFIYGQDADFQSVLGPAIRENVGGIALAEIRTLFANIAPADVNASWIGVVIPHELTHLVFDTATRNPYHQPPHWMNEGLAVYLSEGYSANARASVERAARRGEIMPLRSIVGMFPTTAERFGLAYDESVSAIDYLIRAHGQEALVTLIRSYADGVSDDEAFDAALGVDVAGFEAGWLGDLGIEEPAPYGPLPAPPGPVPPDWVAEPVPTANPDASGQPAPTFRTATPDSGDLTGPITTAILAVLAIILAVGLFIVARGLSRGAPLLAPLGVDAEEFDVVEGDDDDGSDVGPDEDPDDGPDDDVPGRNTAAPG